MTKMHCPCLREIHLAGHGLFQVLVSIRLPLKDANDKPLPHKINSSDELTGGVYADLA